MLGIYVDIFWHIATAFVPLIVPVLVIYLLISLTSDLLFKG